MNNSFIQSDPKIMMGKPVVVGTRVTVESIIERLGAGETPDQIVVSHPRLTHQAILASASFAAQALRADVVYSRAS